MTCKLCTRIFAHLFEKGYEYRAVNSQRSAISAYHYAIEGVAVGKHSYVCALVCSFFNKKPPTPRYSVTRDVQLALDDIKPDWVDSKEFIMKDLSYELVTLLALTSALSTSGLQGLDVRFMRAYQDMSHLFLQNCTKVGQRVNALPHCCVLITTKMRHCVLLQHLTS